MLTIWGAKQRFCDGITRRNFLKIGAFGAGLSLAECCGCGRAPAAPFRRSNKSAIMIYLPGGPSHMDMYDLKPDAPVEFRGEFKPIQTNVPGVQICEHFPRQAQMWDKLACIRSLIAAPEHSDLETCTGYSEAVNRPPTIRRSVRSSPAPRQQRHAALRQPARHVVRAGAGLPGRCPSGFLTERPRHG